MLLESVVGFDLSFPENHEIQNLEKELLRLLFKKDQMLEDAETNLSPALIANYQ